MILLYLIIITIVALFSYKYIFGGKEAMRARKNMRLQRKINAIWKRQFEANMADIEQYWKCVFAHKKQKISVKGAFKCYEKAWVE